MNLKQNWPFAVFIVIFLFTFIDRGGIPFLSHAVAAVLLGFTTLIFHFLKKERERFTWPELFFLLYIIWFILSLIFSEAREYGFTELLSLIIGYLVFSFAVHGGFSRVSSRAWKYIFGGVMGFTLLIGIYAFIFLPVDRFTGPFLNFQKLYEAYPNDFASIALMAIPFSFFFLFKSKTSRERNFFLFFSGLLLSVLFLTLSRGAWAAFLAAVIFALVIGYFIKFPSTAKNFFRTVGICFLISIVSTGTLLFARSQYEKLARLTDRFSGYEGGSGIHERLEFWNGTLQMIKTEPFLGHGPVSFKFMFPRYQKTFGIAQDQPHNVYLKIAAENGIPALLFFLALLSLIIIASLKKLWRTKDPLLFTTLMAVSAILFQNFVDDTLNFVSNAILFWGIIGFLLYESKDKLRLTPVKPMNAAWIPLILSILILPLTFHEFWYNLQFKIGKDFPVGGFFYSEARLAKAENLIFKRDLRVHLVKLFESQYFEGKNEEILKKWKKVIREGMEKEYHDAEIFFSAGKLARITGKKIPAYLNFQKALERDSHNALKYHYYYALSRDKLGQKNDLPKLRLLLLAYTELLRKNAHFTVASDNPFYAERLYEFLITRAENDIQKQVFQLELEIFKKIREEEERRFSRRYY